MNDTPDTISRLTQPAFISPRDKKLFTIGHCSYFILFFVPYTRLTNFAVDTGWISSMRILKLSGGADALGVLLTALHVSSVYLAWKKDWRAAYYVASGCMAYYMIYWLMGPSYISDISTLSYIWPIRILGWIGNVMALFGFMAKEKSQDSETN